MGGVEAASMGQETDDEPWYEEHATKPKGCYGARPFRPTATDDPENRHGVALHHHTDYGSTDFQRRLATGLAILREAPERVVIVGGDLERGGRNRVYRHIRWNPDENTYEMMQENDGWDRTRHKHQELADVLNALDDVFNDDSFVFAHLIYVKNSPFNLPEERRTVTLAA